MLTCSLWRPLPALGSLACSRARRSALKPSISSPCCSARAAIACCEEFAYLQVHDDVSLFVHTHRQTFNGQPHNDCKVCNIKCTYT